MAVSMSIISPTGAEPHFSACSTSTFFARPVAMSPAASRIVLSLVEPKR